MDTLCGLVVRLEEGVALGIEASVYSQEIQYYYQAYILNSLNRQRSLVNCNVHWLTYRTDCTWVLQWTVKGCQRQGEDHEDQGYTLSV